MKETSDDHEVRPVGQLARVQGAGVPPLDHRHARILADPPVELAVGHVERRHGGGPALEQAVGEPAGRGAHVQAAAALRARARTRPGRCSSFTPPRETYGAGRADGELGVLGHQLTRLARAPAVRPPARRRPSPRRPPAIASRTARARRAGYPAGASPPAPGYPASSSVSEITQLPTGRRSLECVTLARLISPSLRSGLLMVVGTGLILAADRSPAWAGRGR